MDERLINKYIAGDSSQKEKEMMQLWIEADKENYKKYLSLRTLYNITLANFTEESVLENRKNKIRVRWISDILKIAAAIILTFGLSFYYFTRDQSEMEAVMQTVYVPVGQRVELTLSDGTKVWLNSLTTFKFPNHFTSMSRDVYLDGEGYFDVAHDGKRYFNVKTEKHTITVLGTEFNIFAYEKKNIFETTLINGCVEISTVGKEQKTILNPGYVAYEQDSQLKITPLLNLDHLLWRKGLICFVNKSIKEILADLEIYYDIKIENHNKKIEGMRYTGKFRTKDGIEHILDVLQVPTGLRYVRDNEKDFIRIY